MTTDLREGLALALVNNDRTRQGWTNARWVDFDESTQRDYLANADCALAFIRAHDDTKAMDDLRSPFNACSLKGRCIETADKLDRARDGHAEFVRGVVDILDDRRPDDEDKLFDIRALCATELMKEKS